jgi:hypothetical protein
LEAADFLPDDAELLLFAGDLLVAEVLLAEEDFPVEADLPDEEDLFAEADLPVADFLSAVDDFAESFFDFVFVVAIAFSLSVNCFLRKCFV